MAPINHTVKVTVLGIDGVLVSSQKQNIPVEPCSSAGRQAVHAVASFSRGKKNSVGESTIKSSPLQPYSGSTPSPGIRHAANWDECEEEEKQGSSSSCVNNNHALKGNVVKLQTKLNKKASHHEYESRPIEVTVGLVHKGETVVLGFSRLHLEKPTTEQKEYNLPINPIVVDVADTAGGASSKNSAWNRFGRGKTSTVRTMHHVSLGPVTFSSDTKRMYGLGSESFLRVLVSVGPTKDLKRTRSRHRHRREESSPIDRSDSNRNESRPRRRGANRKSRRPDSFVIVRNMSLESDVSSITCPHSCGGDDDGKEGRNDQEERQGALSPRDSNAGNHSNPFAGLIQEGINTNNHNAKSTKMPSSRPPRGEDRRHTPSIQSNNNVDLKDALVQSLVSGYSNFAQCKVSMPAGSYFTPNRDSSSDLTSLVYENEALPNDRSSAAPAAFATSTQDSVQRAMQDPGRMVHSTSCGSFGNIHSAYNSVSGSAAGMSSKYSQSHARRPSSVFRQGGSSVHTGGLPFVRVASSFGVRSYWSQQQADQSRATSLFDNEDENEATESTASSKEKQFDNENASFFVANRLQQLRIDTRRSVEKEEINANHKHAYKRNPSNGTIEEVVMRVGNINRVTESTLSSF